MRALGIFVLRAMQPGLSCIYYRVGTGLSPR